VIQHYFRAAASQWGEGKVHGATWNQALGRWVAMCQRLDPLKGGHDAYDGVHYEASSAKPDQVSCKRCLSLLAIQAWAPLIEKVQRYMYNHQGPGEPFANPWAEGPVSLSSLRWRAEQAVRDFAAADQLLEPPSDDLDDLGTYVARNYGRRYGT
jgi:hypothetical protein